jgi:GNAT superfamily N-acetyltransferase
LKRHALSSTENGYGRTYVAVNDDDNIVIGYCTLSMTYLDLEILPGSRDGKPKRLPAILLGRIAVDQNHQRRGIGRRLMKHAFRQAVTASKAVGANVFVLDAIDTEAKEYYCDNYDFLPLTDDPLHLFLPMSTIYQLCDDEE